MLSLLLLALATPRQRPSAYDPLHPIINVGWHDELKDVRTWGPLAMDNKAHVRVSSKGKALLWLDQVPNGWPYTFQWSGITKDARVDIARFPVLMARVEQVKGYAHLDIDVLDAAGKAVKTLRSTTVNGPGLSTIDFTGQLDPAVYSLRLRLIVGGENTGCSATYDWVRFVGQKDSEFLRVHPDHDRIKVVDSAPQTKRGEEGPVFDATEIPGAITCGGLNEDGMVAGIKRNADGSQVAFVWRRGRFVWTGAGYSLVRGPNNKGQVALSDGKDLFLWQRGKVRKCEKPEPSAGFGGGMPPQQILGIDDSGTITALAEGFDNAFSVLVWPRSTKGGFGGREIAPFRPMAIGPDGSKAGVLPWIAPESRGGMPAAYCFLKLGGNTIPIGDNVVHLQPTAVSSDRQVVGKAEGYRPQPFWWRGGELIMLPLPNTESTGTANGVNSAGDVVGSMTWNAHYTIGNTESSEFRQAAAIWLAGRLLELDTRLTPKYDLRLVDALAINDRGEVVAAGYRKSAPGSGGLLFLQPLRPRR